MGTLTLAATNGLQFSIGDGVADATMTFTATIAQLNTALNGLTQNLAAGYTGDAGVSIKVDDQGNTGTGGALSDNSLALATVLPGPVNDPPIVNVPGPQRTPVDTPIKLGGETNNAISIVDDAGDNPVRVSINVSHGTITIDQRVGRETIANTLTAGTQNESRIAMLPDGSYIATWTTSTSTTGTEVRAQRFDATGARLGAEWRVNTTNADNQHAPAIAADPTGGFVIAWVSDNQDGSGSGVYVQRYDVDGNAVGVETRANTTIDSNQTAPAVGITASGAVVVVWQSAEVIGQGSLGVFMQRFDVNGEPAGDETLVNQATSGDQSAPLVAMDASGNYIVVWQGQDADKEGIFARRFDVDGNALSNEFLVNQTTVESQKNPSLAMNAAGQWVVAWQGNTSGNNADIFGRRFDFSGNAIGNEFTVNTTTSGNQSAPAVAINDSGATVFAWQSSDANGQGVYSQTFDASGNAGGVEQRVNFTTAGDQVTPTVGIASDGNYRVMWTSDGIDGSQTAIASQAMLRADALFFNTGSGVNNTSVSITGKLADINAILDGMIFTPAAGYTGTANVAVTVDDQGSTGVGGAKIDNASVDIVVGNAPLLDLDANDSSGRSGADFLVNFRAGLGAVLLADADATLTDPNSGNLQGLYVVLTNPQDGANEVLAATTNGTNIIAAYDSSTYMLTLSGTASVASYQTVLRTVTYNNLSATPTLATRTVSMSAYDGQGYSNIATTTVSYGNTSSAPVAHDDAYTVLKDQPLSVPANGVLANDTDADADPLAAVLVNSPSHGSLTLNSDGSFDYQPDLGFTGTDVFTYYVADPELNSGIATVEILVTSFNHAPAGADATLTTTEDGPIVLVSGFFGYTDPNDSPADTFAGVILTELPTAGTLTLYGTSVSAGDFIDAASIADNALVYTPPADASGAALDSIGFQVRDVGGTLNGGADTDPTIRHLTIDVTALNDAPSISGNAAMPSVAEDTINPTGKLISASFGGSFSDPDPGASLLGVAVVDNPADSATQGVWQYSEDGGANWFAIGSVNDGASALAVNSSTMLRFVPAANFNGTPPTLGVRAIDDTYSGAFSSTSGTEVRVTIDTTTNGGSSAISALASNLSVTVTPVADTPSVTSAATNELTQTTSGLVISRNVVDGPAVTHFQITSISGGTLYQNDGVTPIADGDFITFAEGNAGLRFTPTPSFGADGQFTVQASTAGSSVGLAGGTVNATITVSTVNLAPVVALSSAELPYLVGAGPLVVDGAVTISDLRTSTLTGATVQLSGTTPGEDILAFVDQNGIAGSWDATSGTLTLSGNATLAQYEAALSSVTYENVGASPAISTPRSVAFLVDDGFAQSAGASLPIRMIPARNTPAVSSAVTNEGEQTTSGLMITPDPAGTATVNYFKITGITGGTLFLLDGTTPINNNDFIALDDGTAGVRFTPSSSADGSFNVRSSTTSDDSGLVGTAVGASITVNTVPLITTGSPTGVQYTEGDSPLTIAPAMAVSDADSAQLVGATVHLIGYVSGQDVLEFVSQNGIAGSWDSISGTLTLSGTSSVANYQAALRLVTYSNSSSDPSEAPRTAEITVDDGIGQSGAVDVSIAVTRVDPVVTLPGGDVTYSEGDSPVAVIADVQLTHLPGATINHATLTIAQGYEQYEDQLQFTSQNGIAGQWDQTTGTLTLSGQASVAAYQQAMRSVTFINSSSDPDETDRQVDVTINDGATDSATVSRAIHVIAVNTPPTTTIPTSTQQATSDQPLVFSPGTGNRIFVADADVRGAAVRVLLKARRGEISLPRTDGLTLSMGTGAGDAMIEFTGMIPNVNAALNGLTFTSNGGYSGAASLRIMVNDLGNSGAGGARVADVTVPIVVTSNQVPQPTPSPQPTPTPSPSPSPFDNGGGGTPINTTTTTTTSDSSATDQTSDSGSHGSEGDHSKFHGGGESQSGESVHPGGLPGKLTVSIGTQFESSIVDASIKSASAKIASVSDAVIADARADIRIRNLQLIEKRAVETDGLEFSWFNRLRSTTALGVLSGSSPMWLALDQLHGSMTSDKNLRVVAGAATFVTVGMSFVYFFWAVRAGSVLTSVLSSVPVWKAVDPLPILNQVGDRPEEEDTESLDSLVSGNRKRVRATVMGPKS